MYWKNIIWIHFIISFFCYHRHCFHHSLRFISEMTSGLFSLKIKLKNYRTSLWYKGALNIKWKSFQFVSFIFFSEEFHLFSLEIPLRLLTWHVMTHCKMNIIQRTSLVNILLCEASTEICISICILYTY